jgi:hypothetical protein
MTTNVVYVVKDGGSDRYCKIGKDTIWPFRFHQAQSHTPRGIDLVGAWTFRRDELDQMERKAHAGLPRRRDRVLQRCGRRRVHGPCRVRLWSQAL